MTDWNPDLHRCMEEGTQAFLAAYERRIALAYGPRADGKRVLAFPRLLFVAQKR